MIYCQLRPEAELPLGKPLRLGQVARLIAPEGAEDIPLPCPDREGVWRLDALLCARALRSACPGEEVSLLGAESCYIRRIKPHRPDPLRWLRALAACLILLLGSALGLSWFHSDVDMPAAQVMVYRLLTGQGGSMLRTVDTATRIITRENMFTIDGQKALFAFE